MAIAVFAGKYVGLKCLEFLISKNYPIAHVVVASENDKKLLDLARQAKIPNYVFDTKAGVYDHLRSQHFTWLLNLWSPHILPADILDLAENRLNIHPSYAPHCLGSDSATWAIRRQTTPGVSLLEMSTGIDKGSIFVQRKVAWHFPEPAHVLFARLKEEAVDLFCEKWDAIYRKTVTAIPQSDSGSYQTLKMTRTDRVVQGSTTMRVDELINWALAHDFSPNSTSEVTLDSGTYSLTITLKKKQ